MRLIPSFLYRTAVVVLMASWLAGAPAQGDPAALVVTKTPSPAFIVEPGATVSFMVRVDNSGISGDLALMTLVDDVHGDLNGQGTCLLPQAVSAGGSYECGYDADVIGGAGTSAICTVMATARDGGGRFFEAMDSATVTITDGQPRPAVAVTATPSSLDPPGDVTFTVRVDNEGQIQPFTLLGLSDDVHGDLDGRGTCALPQAVAVGASYQCDFTVHLDGAADTSTTNTVTADVEDGLANMATDSDTATVSFLDGPPEIAVSMQASPAIIAAPGDDVIFVIRIENLRAVDPVTITELSDSRRGDLLADRCPEPVPIAVGETYGCTFGGFVNGVAGMSDDSTLTVTAEDDEGSTVQVQDDAAVQILEAGTVIWVDGFETGDTSRWSQASNRRASASRAGG